MKLQLLMGVCFGLSACIAKGPSIVNDNLPAANPEKQILDVANYSDAQWENFGFYDGGGRFEHQYGGKDSGFYEYRFRGLDKVPGQFIVRARISAESSTKGLPEEKSDVTLSVNGVELGTQTVVPDDSEGQIYQWNVNEPGAIASLQLKPGEQNTLRFEVKKQAALRHGLCLYGAGLSPDKEALPITIEMPAQRQR